MTGNFTSTKTLCLLNENAQCNPIWLSRPDGLKLVHFQTFQQESTGRECMSVDADMKIAIGCAWKAAICHKSNGVFAETCPWNCPEGRFR